LTSSGPTQTQQSLYNLSQNDFNVITSGSNGYAAAAGYSLVTGLGTSVANLLVPDLIAGNFPATGLVPPASAAAFVNSGTSAGNANGAASALTTFNVFAAMTADGGADASSSSADAAATADSEGARGVPDFSPDSAPSLADAVYATGGIDMRDVLNAWWVANAPALGDGNITAPANGHDRFMCGDAGTQTGVGLQVASPRSGATDAESVGQVDDSSLGRSAGGTPA